MSQVFLKILNMSISAGIVVLVVLVLRLALKKAPGWITVLLWGIVGLRLICPFSIQSALSLIPSAEPISRDIMSDATSPIKTGFSTVNNAVNPVIGETLSSTVEQGGTRAQVLIPVLSVIWLVGVAVMLAYSVISYARVRHTVRNAQPVGDGVFVSDGVGSPFVLGLIKPKIYLPRGLDETAVSCIVAHESAHIRRMDHIWKPIGFMLLSLYWFNPLLWVGYVLLCRDIELACDEKVIAGFDREMRADYSQTLLSCSVKRHTIAACPIAFGEVGVGKRVKAVLNYKRPAFWIIVVSLVVCVACAVCFLTNPKDTDNSQNELKEQYSEFFGLDASDGLDVVVWSMAEDSMSFALCPHGQAEKYTQSGNVKGASLDNIRTILASYDIPRDKIYVVPWQNPASSYIAEAWLIGKGENAEEERQAYIEKIESLLFEGEKYYVTWVYCAPMFSYVMHTSCVPNVSIEGKELFNAVTGEKLGRVSRVSLTAAALDGMMPTDSTLGEKLRASNVCTYKVYPTEVQGTDLYYIMIQENGDTLLVYGLYDDAGKPSETIRWIYQKSIYDGEAE